MPNSLTEITFHVNYSKTFKKKIKLFRESIDLEIPIRIGSLMRNQNVVDDSVASDLPYRK